ncbi:MAG: 3-deoxy-manno-octulosonate cytidylyltransferase, partial [Mailhella sp.]|nr:3-deoxy-manno-octulosonate cytidylyltransferase [Mailhella sp.]
HIGMYAYRRQFLMDFGKLPYSKLENTEKLEQLRVLEAGIAIRCLIVDAMAPGVDTPEDLEAVRRIVAEREARPCAQ